MTNYPAKVLLAYLDYAIDHFIEFGGFPCEFEYKGEVYNNEECSVMRQDLRLTKLYGYHVEKDRRYA